ncbi:MAG TPA: NADH:flavin oxidoreductase [Pyrinomonadaceae bacterium]|jgi:2,4-dienoyl-CoA reductase (NADPH2)
MNQDIIFEPLRFRNLEVKNRIFRSNISGKFDCYNGIGTQTRINWENKFARGGVGAIISSHVPISIRGRILTNYAVIDSDDKIPFWRKVGENVHEYDCKYIMQLSHGGRQQDVGGIENAFHKGLSSTGKTDSFHGLLCQAMTRDEIKMVVRQFADAARRVREAGLDGIELHACNGYLINQFLSSGINDRKDEYGGSLENRTRFLLEIMAAVRKEVGDDFHFQVKISAVDHNNALAFWEKKGNTLEDSIQVCKWVEEAGADALHISMGSTFPHPLNPPGGFPLEHGARTYGVMIPSGVYTFRNFLLFRYRPLRPIFNFLWNRTKPDIIEGINVDEAYEIKKQVKIPVLCTGGFQTASYIRKVITDGYCDGVAIARPLVANNDLVKIFAAGKDLPDKPCTYCNKCLVHAISDPLGCYELSRYDGDYERMISEIMSVFTEMDSNGAKL